MKKTYILYCLAVALIGSLFIWLIRDFDFKQGGPLDQAIAEQLTNGGKR